jgi:hypothetical protein
MRRLVLAVLAAAVPLALAAPAAADHHLMKVSEVATSYGAMNGQFVELKDDVDEPFPPTSAPYALAVFDANGNPAGMQDLGNPFIAIDTSQPFLVASDDTGIGPAGRDATLSVTLPAGAGTVCFTSGAFGRVHCVAYGCPAVVVSSRAGSQSGQAPPSQQSLQRLGGSLSIATATPDAPNASGAPASCSGAPGDGGPGGGGPGGGGSGDGAGDTTRPGITSSARRRQDVDRLVVAVRLSEGARLTVSASVNVPVTARTLRFKTVRRTVAAGVRTRVRLRLTRARLRAVKQALRRGRRLTARVKITARDAAGNTSTARRSLRLTNDA